MRTKAEQIVAPATTAAGGSRVRRTAVAVIALLAVAASGGIWTATSGGDDSPRTWSAVGEGYTFGAPMTLPVSTSVTSFDVYTAGGSSAQEFVPALYSVGTDGAPETLITTAQPVVVAAGSRTQHVTVRFAAALSAGRYYAAMYSTTGGDAKIAVGDTRLGVAAQFSLPSFTRGTRSRDWFSAQAAKRLRPTPTPSASTTSTSPSASPSASPTPTTASPSPTTASPTPTTASPTPTTASPSPTTASPTPTTASPSPTTASPSASATTSGGTAGVLAGVARTSVTGDFVARTDGATISNLTVSGTFYIAANNVTVSNVKAGGFSFNAAPGGNYYYPVKNSMTLSHVEAVGVSNVGGTHINIYDSRFGQGQTGTAIQLTSYYDGTKMFPCDYIDMQRNVVDGLASIPANSGVHSEAIHLLGARHVILRNNNLRWMAPDAGTKSQITGVFVNQSAYGVTPTDVVIDGNDISGGGYYQIYATGTASVMSNNRFISAGGGNVLYPLTSADSMTRYGNRVDGTLID
ncbi:MAG: hypothetical protein JWM93_2639 [Frankiales bacterium]|nr:hypothetical protein [Frankiales bacterium]